MAAALTNAAFSVRSCSTRLVSSNFRFFAAASSFVTRADSAAACEKCSGQHTQQMSLVRCLCHCAGCMAPIKRPFLLCLPQMPLAP